MDNVEVANKKRNGGTCASFSNLGSVNRAALILTFAHVQEATFQNFVVVADLLTKGQTQNNILGHFNFKAQKIPGSLLLR